MSSAKMTLLIVLLTIFLNVINITTGNESPGFFVKVAKNVPRIGRRSGDFFLKSSKNVPRIGRRSSDDDQFDDNDYDIDIPKWFTQLILASKRDQSGTVIKSYNNIQPFDSFNLYEIINNDKSVGNDLNSFKFVSWNDFDIALEKDDVLYKKLIELSHDKDLAKLLTTNKNWMHIDNFVPLESNDVNNVNHYDADDSFYYRANRQSTEDKPLYRSERTVNNLETILSPSSNKAEGNDLINRNEQSIVGYSSPSDDRLKELLNRSHRTPVNYDRLKQLLARAHRSTNNIASSSPFKPLAVPI